MSNRSSLFAVLLMLGVVLPAASAETVELPGRVDAVTVYRGQALVTRTVEVPGPAGLREVVVTDLPEHVIPGSLHAEGGPQVEVRSVRYRTRPMRRDVREEVRKLDAEIRALQDQREALSEQRALAEQHEAYLASLECFVAPTATVELSKGVLDATTLKEMTQFVFEERQQLLQGELDRRPRMRDLQEQIELLQRRRGKVAGSSARTVREAVVFVDLHEAGGGQMQLHYLVSQASWYPFYNIRTESEREFVLVEYNASVQQTCGEDWNDVSMTLSTATPSLTARAPELTPLAITVAPDAPTLRALVQKGENYEQARQRLRSEQTQFENARNAPRQHVLGQQGQSSVSGQLHFLGDDRELNRLAADLQNLDLLSRERVRRKSKIRSASNEGVTVTYAIAARTSLPSRSDRQLIRIAPLRLPGSFYKVATPVLTEYVYDEAQVTNGSEMVLLAGSAATYKAGQFVGHGAVPTVAVGQSFTVGFGIDSALRAGRELVEKKEITQGGNRVVDLTYRLTLENFGIAPAAVRLFERLPKTTGADIKVTLGDTGDELSDDGTYRHAQHKQGILRWDLEVPAQAQGPDASALEYDFRLEYDRKMSITGLAMSE
ncbi:MAG: mucoidy inhibitor MuiA family protein [bacterium]|nr:mucoidy inhibitor MuiA family protein [bacterium]